MVPGFAQNKFIERNLQEFLIIRVDKTYQDSNRRVIGVFRLVKINKDISTEKEEAIKFSFLIAIPALLGAAILNLSDIQSSITFNMIIGSLISI